MHQADDAVTTALNAHVRRFFGGLTVRPVDHALPDRTRGTDPRFRVLEVAPGGPNDPWTYVTAGCCRGDDRGLEFVMTAPVSDPRFADLLAMVVSYHRDPADRPLDLGHSLPIGEPWLPGSACTHLLVSLPYLHGPDLEHCPLPDGTAARFLWLLPVTDSEIAYRREHGTEALERLFDEAAINPVDPHRAPVT
ncbi:suppressor of fused domain protein [Streptomyces sp. NPDC001927]